MTTQHARCQLTITNRPFGRRDHFDGRERKFRDEIDISQNLKTILADACKFRDEVDDSLLK